MTLEPLIFKNFQHIRCEQILPPLIFYRICGAIIIETLLVTIYPNLYFEQMVERISLEPIIGEQIFQKNTFHRVPEPIILDPLFSNLYVDLHFKPLIFEPNFETMSFGHNQNYNHRGA